MYHISAKLSMTLPTRRGFIFAKILNTWEA
nr:MAG TPA: hypothetical protein [Caudoviricetes sp.]